MQAVLINRRKVPGMAASEWFPERLKEIRERKNITQQQLADLIGVGQTAVARWETGVRKPTWESVLAICDALEISCDEFRKPPKKSK